MQSVIIPVWRGVEISHANGHPVASFDDPEPEVIDGQDIGAAFGIGSQTPASGRLTIQDQIRYGILQSHNSFIEDEYPRMGRSRALGELNGIVRCTSKGIGTG